VGVCEGREKKGGWIGFKEGDELSAEATNNKIVLRKK